MSWAFIWIICRFKNLIYQNSLVFVIASKIAPALRMFFTEFASSLARTWRLNKQPAEFDMPLTNIVSLHVNGTPSRGLFSSLYSSGSSSDKSM